MKKATLCGVAVVQTYIRVSLMSIHSHNNPSIQHTQVGFVRDLRELGTQIAPGHGNSVCGTGVAGLGLSTAQGSSVSVRSGSVTFYRGGGIVRVVGAKLGNRVQVGGGPRGLIRGFSRQSRLRLLRLLGMIDQSEVPLFVTLTYPGVYVADGERWKRDLDVFCLRLRRRYPQSGVIWRLEAQARGAPHYHLLLWGVAYTGELLAWVSRAWYEVVASGDERHLRAGTQVARIRSWRGVTGYAAKYLSKVGLYPDSAGWENVGRAWGIRDGQNIPWAEVVNVPAGDAALVRMLRVMRRSLRPELRRRVRNLSSLTIFVVSSSFWLSCAVGILRPP